MGANDKIGKIFWTKKFMEKQGYKVKINRLYQDNKSSILPERNRKESSGKRTRHFDIKYFYITGLVSRDKVTVEYCPTKIMWADFHTKPQVGKKFVDFWNKIMNGNSWVSSE